MKKIILFAIIMTCNHLAKAQKALPKFGKSTNAAVIAAMKSDEKVHFVVGLGMKMPGMKVLENMPVVGQTLDKVAGAAGSTTAIPRLGIPSFVVADGPAGLRIMPKREGDDKTYFCTAFPVATLLASTWDVDLVQKVGAAMGDETKAYGVDILLGPAMNIHRNPLGGRNFEYYSEDPLVAGKMAISMVRGIQSNGVGTSIKHFAVNNHEANRNFINVVVSERALREIYLRGFEMCVKESNPWTVMSSYNKINGIYASHNQDLLTKVLRNDWKYKGFVMTDWFGGTDAIEQMKAGNDLLMPGTGKQNADIAEALKNGTLDEKVLDRNIDKILTVLKDMPSFKAYPFSNKPDLKAHGEMARQAASEGAILLKNEKALPLSKGQKVVAFGNFSYDLISGGTGSGDVNEAYTVSLVEGLKNADLGFNDDLKTMYDTYIKTEKAKLPPTNFFMPKVAIPEMELNNEQLTAYANADLAIITIGRYSGEFSDRKLDVDYKLTEKELALIKNVSTTFHAKGKKVAVILNIGGPVDVASWRNDVDAILLAWEGGQEAGNAIADILSGKVNPSGKLATTFSVRYEDEPSAANFPGKEFGEPIKMLGGLMIGHNAEVNYEEGIYIGYRGYDKNKVVPAYEFGYGLSYTSFKISNLSLGAKTFKDRIKVTVDVTNTGQVAGKEVVQLYLSAPSKMMDKPVQELKGFAKTLLLAPNQTQKITFEINARDLASFDEKTSTWVAESGNYTINIGSSSRNIQQKGDFKLLKSLNVEKVTKALVKQ
jgi:beta-glucosidase